MVAIVTGKSGHDSAKEMVLVGKAGDMQSVRFRALGHALPIDAHCNVGLSDSFKGRIEIAMAGSNLNAVPASLVQKAVIDSNHIATPQVCRDFVDPFDCSFIENRFSKRSLDEDELVSIKTYQSLSPVVNYSHWHCV